MIAFKLPFKFNRKCGQLSELTAASVHKNHRKKSVLKILSHLNGNFILLFMLILLKYLNLWFYNVLSQRLKG